MPAVNLVPGGAVTIDGGLTAEIDGLTLASASFTLPAGGYHEIVVTGGDEPVMYPIAVVDVAAISASIRGVVSDGEVASLRELAAALTPGWARDAIEVDQAAAHRLKVQVDRPAVLQVQRRTGAGAYAAVGVALARRAGFALSGRFDLLQGRTSFRLAAESVESVDIPFNPDSLGTFATPATLVVLDLIPAEA